MGIIQYNKPEKEYNYQQLSNELTRVVGTTNNTIKVFHPDNLNLTAEQKQKFQDIINEHTPYSLDFIRIEMAELLDCVTTQEAMELLNSTPVMQFLGGISVGGNVYSISVNVYTHFIGIVDASGIVLTQASQTNLVNKLKEKGLVFPS